MKFKLLDAEHPFFEPLWRRVAVVAVIFGWAVFEYVQGSTGWALVFVGLGLYCLWTLFLTRGLHSGSGEDPKE